MPFRLSTRETNSSWYRLCETPALEAVKEGLVNLAKVSIVEARNCQYLVASSIEQIATPTIENPLETARPNYQPSMRFHISSLPAVVLIFNHSRDSHCK